MKINRNGMEIELTTGELCAAYEEFKYIEDSENVRNMLMVWLEDKVDEVIDNKPLLDKIVRKWREYMDDRETGDAEWDCMFDAYRFATR